MVNIVNHQEAIDYWLKADKLVFFCGSGISQFPPTSFPNGKELNQLIYKSLERQLNLNGINEISLADFEILPLEFLLEKIIDNISDAKYLNNLKKISKYFCQAQPNRLHFLISSFLFHKQNCYIITTNYDNCFEKAYFDISKGDTLESYYIKNMIQAKHHSNKSIFKIHGCAQNDSPNEIVHTTSQESSGLSYSFLEIYKEIFENSTVVFCGYSLSEPDCLEALLEVENYDIIWITTKIESAKENLKIQTLFENANNAFILEDLIPFIGYDWKLLNPLISNYDSDNYGKINLSNGFSELRRNEVKKGFELYEELLIISDSEKLYRLIIECYLQLRDFTKVHFFLEIYNQLNSKSEFIYSFYNSSIERDKNSNWKEAHDLFQKIFCIKNLDSYQQTSAQIEILGIETLISQNERKKLIVTNHKLKDLVEFIKIQSEIKIEDKQKWQKLLGLAQKNYIQNICYQKEITLLELRNSIEICDQSILNLNDSKDIQGRIEALRFKARIYFRIYHKTKDIQELENALAQSKKSYLLFSLLGSNMGIINAARQYILILILMKKFDEAKKEMLILEKMVYGLSDNLSQIKFELLQISYFYKTVNINQFIKTIYRLILVCRKFDNSKSSIANIVNFFKWFIYWKKGISG